MNAETIKDIRILSSIPINTINGSTQTPCAMGSGCFVNYKGNLVFITVHHVIEEETNITHGIVVDYDSENGTLLCQFNDYSICAIGNLMNAKIDIVDFAMKVFIDPMPPCKLLINKSAEGEFERIDRISLTSDFSISPTPHKEYGFCGLINGQLIQNETSLGLYSHLAYYDNVRYLESRDSYHVFFIENKNYSHSDFQGTSGAPIIDSDGNLVSLVMSGKMSSTNPNEWLIYGVNLAEMSTVADINCGLI